MEFRLLLDLANEFLSKRIKGMEYREITQALLRKNLKEEEIAKVISRVKRLEIQYIKKQQANKKFLSNAAIGLLIAVIGFGVTIYTYYIGSNSFIFAYGAIASGMGLLIYNLTRFRK